MSDTVFIIWFSVGVVAALIAFFMSDPFDCRWPDETTRAPQMMFAFIGWPVIAVFLIGLFLYLAWWRMFRTEPTV